MTASPPDPSQQDPAQQPPYSPPPPSLPPQYAPPPSYAAPPPPMPPLGYPVAPMSSPYGSAYSPPPRYPNNGMGYVHDPASDLWLPPGVQLASHGRRIGAYFLSLLLFVVTLGIGWAVWGLVAWNKGSSPAFQVLGLRAYHVDSGRPAGFWRMALRDIVGYTVSGFFGITWLVSFVMFCATAKRQTIADLCATTVVVHDPNHALG